MGQVTKVVLPVECATKEEEVVKFDRKFLNFIKEIFGESKPKNMNPGVA